MGRRAEHVGGSTPGQLPYVFGARRHGLMVHDARGHASGSVPLMLDGPLHPDPI